MGISNSHAVAGGRWQVPVASHGKGKQGDIFDRELAESLHDTSYHHYFGLSEAPFSIAPDPRFLYLSRRHQEALAHLIYGVNGGGGFVLLTGEVGAGKTTVCRCFLEQVPENCDVAFIVNPKLTVGELLSTICTEFHIPYPADTTSVKVFVDRINHYLLQGHAQGRHAVLIIDEAQNLSIAVLEQMRLLTNLETNQRKLLQIILLGQPELATMLERPELRQLAQRIVARYHLGPLNKKEVAAYVRHRLEVSGTLRPLFSASLLNRLYRLSGGIPRLVNLLCDRALLGTYVQGRERVSRATLDQAAREVIHHGSTPRRSLLLPLLVLLILVAFAAIQHGYIPWDGGNAIPIAPVAHNKVLVQELKINKPRVQVQDELLWPEEISRLDSKQLAYAAMFKTWGMEYQGEGACRPAVSSGFRCQTSRGGLDELRQFNRPAVLLMRDKQGREFLATLIGLSEGNAIFSIGQTTQTISLIALAAQWSGYFTVLWRLPPSMPINIKSGESGPTVSWLSQQLAEVQQRENDIHPVFDATMVARLKQFQLSQGLVPDGTLGQRTLARLDSVADRTAPRLGSQPRDK